MTLFLASTSPRRRDLLLAAGLPFEVVEPGAEPCARGEPHAVALLRARAKCLGARVPGAAAGAVLGVDTVVDLDGRELGKPAGRAQALDMLLRLAGREHAVHTALCLRTLPDGVIRERVATARVFVRPIPSAELEAYLDTGDWQDKAGGYGIQSHAGAFCTLVAGARDTVVGLPVATLRQLLEEAGPGG